MRGLTTIRRRSKISRVESPTVNFVFIVWRKSDGGWDAVVRYPKATTREALALSPALFGNELRDLKD